MFISAMEYQPRSKSWSRIVRLLLALALATSGLIAAASLAPPVFAQQFGTEDDCVHDSAFCSPDGFVAMSGNWGEGCQWHETLDWGDGTVINRVIDGGAHPISHQYNAPGLYTITSTGFGVADDPDERICTFVDTSYLIEVPSPTNGGDDDDDDTGDSPRLIYVERNADRTDRPVREGRVSRTWMWGHWFLPHFVSEPYNESPNGEREVTYFDKSRMEVNDPHGDPDDLWYVTNGLLVVEMVEGKFQIGDDEFDHSPEPADVPIGGDPLNPDAPTYADINTHNLRGAEPLAEGSTIVQSFITGVVDDYYYDQYGVTAAHRVQIDHIDHTVASVFWDFMNSQGTVYEDGDYLNDQLFINPFYATGLPITEAYWSNILVGGEPTDVLWQCFERRCLTYNPANDEGWQVEAANVGQHYYYWRYGERPWE